jgi:DNA-binding GntR family transcriptional regulator
VLKIEPKPDLVAQTRAAIRGAIIAGELPPRCPLAQEDLASKFGVSRQPISHALVMLKQEGLVVDRGRKGQMVAPIDPEKLLALYQVRGALDRLAARLAATTAHKSSFGLLEIVDRGTDALNKRSVEALVSADIAFHSALYELSGNNEITITAENFWPHIARSMRVVLEDKDQWPRIWDEHRAIAQAIEDGNIQKAGDLATDHAENSGEATYQRLLSEQLHFQKQANQ